MYQSTCGVYVWIAMIYSHFNNAKTGGCILGHTHLGQQHISWVSEQYSVFSFSFNSPAATFTSSFPTLLTSNTCDLAFWMIPVLFVLQTVERPNSM